MMVDSDKLTWNAGNENEKSDFVDLADELLQRCAAGRINVAQRGEVDDNALERQWFVFLSEQHKTYVAQSSLANWIVWKKNMTNIPYGRDW